VQPTPEGQPEVSRDSIHRYVWSRYIDYGPAPFALNEQEALAFLERHYQEHPLTEDAECFYYGILAYEHSFAAPPELRDSYLARAVEAFTAYRDQVVGPVWEPVADRLEDARTLLALPSAGSP
jgi:hypothetical protein